jgi:hypothetical protein
MASPQPPRRLHLGGVVAGHGLGRHGRGHPGPAASWLAHRRRWTVHPHPGAGRRPSALRILSRESCAPSPPRERPCRWSCPPPPNPASPRSASPFSSPCPKPTFPVPTTFIRSPMKSMRSKGLRELRRIAAPCSGPFTNAPVTNLLLKVTSPCHRRHHQRHAAAEWPPPDRYRLPGPAPFPASRARPARPKTPPPDRSLIQAATGIRSPVERAPRVRPRRGIIPRPPKTLAVPGPNPYLPAH